MIFTISTVTNELPAGKAGVTGEVEQTDEAVVSEADVSDEAKQWMNKCD